MTRSRLGWWWAIAPVLGLGLVAFAYGHVQLGGYLVAGGVWLAALLRLVLPTARSGGLVVRSRVADVVTMVALGVGLVVVTSLLDLHPRS